MPVVACEAHKTLRSYLHRIRDSRAVAIPLINQMTDSCTILRRHALAIQAGAAEDSTVILLRDRLDSATMRVGFSDRSTVIMKFWDRQGWRASLRRWTRTTPSWREWTAMQRLRTRRVPIPRPIARFNLGCRIGRFSEVLVIEDLGDVRTAHEELKEALIRGDENLACTIDDHVIALTTNFVGAGVIDPDHSVVNMLSTPDGDVHRIDLELARVAPATWCRPGLYSQMIARLVGSYVFTVQPDLKRASLFSTRIADELAPPRRILRLAKTMIDTTLERQRQCKGIDSRLLINW